MTTATAETVRVQWTCRNMVSQNSRFAQVHAFAFCREVFTATTTRAEYEAKQARARCPRCGAMVRQGSDGCEVAS